MVQIKFIYFDVGGVLVDWSNVFKTAAQKFDITVSDIDSVFEAHHDDITNGAMSAPEFWQTCIDKYHLKNAAGYDFLDSWVGDYQPILPTHTLVHILKGDYQIGLLSNIYKGMLPLLLQKRLIPNIDYRSIIFSCDVGMKKPDPEIYELAQKRAKTSPENILLIDDRPDYLDAAAKQSWQTFLFDTKNPDSSIIQLKKLQ